MSASIALQKEVSISYLGSPGTFSHQAAHERLGDSVAYIPQKQINGKISFVTLEFGSQKIKTFIVKVVDCQFIPEILYQFRRYF